MRVVDHPVLPPKSTRKVTIRVDGVPVDAVEGEPILAALWAAGILTCGETDRRKRPRGAFCGIGRCGDCRMEVDGERDVYTCSTPVRDGMRIRTQRG